MFGSSFLVLLLFVYNAICQPHPFNAEDMVTLHRLGAASVNPSGTRAVYTFWSFDLDQNKSGQSLRSVDLLSCNGTISTVTETEIGVTDYNPVWVNDQVIAFLSTRSGSSQIWTVKHGDPSSAKQLSTFPIDIENFKVFDSTVHGQAIGLTGRVYADKTMEETHTIDQEIAAQPFTGQTFDKLFFRRWDHFDDKKYSHLFVAPLSHNGAEYVIGAATDLMKGLALETPVAPFGGVSDFDFCPSGSQAAFAAHRPGADMAWTTNVDIYITNVTGLEEPISITDSNVAQDTFPVFSPDGKYLAYLAMKVPKYEADRRRVVIYNRETKVHTTLTEDWDRSPDSIVWSSDSQSIFVTVQDNGRSNIYQINISSHNVEMIVEGNSNSGISLTTQGLVFSRSNTNTPNEIFTFNINNGAVKQCTFENAEKLEQTIRSEIEEFWFEGALGDQVHGWLLKPVGFEEGKKYPVAFLVHGGPQSAWLDSFSTRWNPQVFAGAGFVAIAIDPHGSTSYGQAFTDAINGEWGSHPYDDLMMGLDYITQQYSFIDGNRVAALGGSYGGWMMNWLNGNTDRFSCLVNHCGLSDTTAMYFATEELFFPEYDFRGTPWESDLYEKWNPLRLVTNWKTPTLVIHGGKDYRVVDGQGFATFTALQRQGVKSRLLYFADENHWVLKPANSLQWYSESISWISECTSA